MCCIVSSGETTIWETGSEYTLEFDSAQIASSIMHMVYWEIWDIQIWWQHFISKDLFICPVYSNIFRGLAWCQRCAGNRGTHQQATEKQPDTCLCLGCAWWVSDKLCSVTCAVCSSALPACKIFITFFVPVTVFSRLWNGFRALLPFRQSVTVCLQTADNSFKLEGIPSLLPKVTLICPFTNSVEKPVSR